MSCLKELRQKAGISQAELAKRTGISVRTIQSYEQNARPLNGISLESAVILADALGLSDVRMLLTTNS